MRISQAGQHSRAVKIDYSGRGALILLRVGIRTNKDNAIGFNGNGVGL